MLPNKKIKKNRRNKSDNIARYNFKKNYFKYLIENEEDDDYIRYKELEKEREKREKIENKYNKYLDENDNDTHFLPYSEFEKKEIEKELFEKKKQQEEKNKEKNKEKQENITDKKAKVREINEEIEIENKEENLEEITLQYPFMDTLITEIDEDEINDNSLIEQCVYTINNNGVKPFLLFMLYKMKNQNNNEEFYFTNFQYKKSKNSIYEQGKIKIENLLKGYTLSFKGYKSENYKIPKSDLLTKRHIMFYEVDFNNELNELYEIKKEQSIWWISVSEIFNYNSVMYFKVNDTVISLFNNNISLMQLFNNNQLVETPIVCYYGSNYRLIAYICSFGIKKSPLTSRFGPYYYFTTFNDSMRYACYSNDFKQDKLSDGTILTINDTGKYIKGGIVRFVIFTGAMKVFMKRDKPDESNMSKYMATQDVFNSETIQFRDSDGLWTDNYNSAYNGKYNIELDDKGKTRNLDVRWCIFEYDNQIPLSYHYIDSSSIPDIYDSKYTNYRIM